MILWINTGCSPGAATYHGYATWLPDAFSWRTLFPPESSVTLTCTQCLSDISVYREAPPVRFHVRFFQTIYRIKLKFIYNAPMDLVNTGCTRMVASSSTFCPHLRMVFRDLFRLLHDVGHGTEALVYSERSCSLLVEFSRVR